MNRLFAIGAAVACCAAAALPAGAASTPKGLWATVNICDTVAHPNMMGVRANIPGDGEHTRMYMRITAQYYSPARQSWSNVQQPGFSNSLLVGSCIYAPRPGGFTSAAIDN